MGRRARIGVWRYPASRLSHVPPQRQRRSPLRYLGVDLHKTNFVACFLDEQERITLQPCARTAKGLAAFGRRVTQEDGVAVEAAPHVAFFYAQGRPRGHEVVVVTPSQVAVSAQSKKKTERHDATLRARSLQLGWWPTVPMPSESMRQVRTLLEAREGSVELRTKLKNMGHALLARNGIAKGRAAVAWARSRPQVLELPALPAVERVISQTIVRQLVALEQEVTALEEALIARGKALPGVERLLQVRGMTLWMAIRLRAESGDIAGFAHAKQLVSYAGLAPSVRQSHEATRHGKLTKRGRKRWRTLAMRAVWALSTGPSTPLAEFYAQKQRQKGAGKALCATARKLLTLSFVMLKQDWDYWDLEDPLYNRKLRLLKKAA
jgi:transposase